jgi:hypothetical protein
MRTSTIRVAAVCGSLLLAACGGGDDKPGTSVDPGPGPSSSQSCVFVPGPIDWTELAGSSPQDLGAANDGDLGSFGKLGGDSLCCEAATITFANRGDGTQYPAGGKAGLYMTLPLGLTVANLTITTLLDGVTQDTAAGPALGDVANPSASPATDYFYVATSKPFDEIDLTINAMPTGEVDLFEFCANAQ